MMKLVQRSEKCRQSNSLPRFMCPAAALILAAFMLLALAGPALAASWGPARTISGTSYLFAITGSGSDVWACGTDGSTGVVVHYTGTWGTPQPITGTAGLDGITGSGSDVWACGVNAAGNTGVVVHYNGTGWTAQTIPGTNWLNGITGSGNDVWASGWDSSYTGVVAHYDGTGWTGGQEIPDPINPNTNYLHCVTGSGSDVWACGANATRTAGAVAHYDGTWGTGGQEIGDTSGLYGITGSGSDVWACGWNGSNVGVVVHYDGNWETPQPITGTYSLDHITGSGSDVWACGTNAASHGAGLVVHYTTAGGWGTAYPISGTSYLYGITGSGSDVWACGTDGSTGVVVHYPVVPPTLTTTTPSSITSTTATSGGSGINDGGASITHAGVCWSTSANPTTSDSHTDDFTGSGDFTSSITGLTPGTGYHVRAYATNSEGTGYGSDLTFTTLATKPVVASVTPSSGPPGTQVTITGSNFGSSQGGSTVTIGGVAAKVVSWSDNQIVITVPEDTNGGAVVVTTAQGGSNTDKTFTVALSTWYLAEGTNAWGFSTYITIENPNDQAVTAKLTYMDPKAPASGKGIAGTRTITLPPLSQTTVSSMSDIGAVDFSTKVECPEGKSIAVDRTVFWTGPGYSPSQSGYHSSIGATSPAKTWYLPEGSSNWGFETWTLIENPNPTAAQVTLTYMTQDQGPKVVQKTVPAYSRATYNMAADIGAADSSIQVSSDIPVVAEESVYKDNRREGSCSIGATTPANDYYLAEGATGYNMGFVTYVLVQNPQSTPTDVTLTYQTQYGQVAGPSFTMAPDSRKTVRVNDTLPQNTNVSEHVHGSQPIVAEHAMYWNNGTGTAFDASIGLPSPHQTFYLPDGSVSPTTETWTLVENPTSSPVTVRISYLLQGGGTPITFTDTVGANSRSTYSMADKIPGGRASIMVQSLDPTLPIMVERSMYMNSRGGGTITIGGFSD